jgi:hypothetical protein
VFGWDPQLLNGQQLPAVLDAFEQWEGKHGSGSSTLLLLQNLAHRHGPLLSRTFVSCQF